MQACSRLYQSEPCTHVLSRLEIEIEARRLSIRPEYSPHSDVGKRESLLQLFLNYNPVWLKLGLEVREREREMHTQWGLDICRVALIKHA